MRNTQDKRDWEKRLLSQMIAIYCRRNHHTPKGKLCEECAALEQYALSRSEHCRFMEEKTFCSNCKSHCYKPDMREKIRSVMRYSGPRMILYHPIASLRHLIDRIGHKRKLS